MGKMFKAPGFRFKPTDVELLKYFLKRKLIGKRLHVKVISEVDVYKHDPWDLPDKSGWDSGDLKWYFFCPREKKYARGNRIQRATVGGYWKTTGKDRSVLCSGAVVGWIKTLIFHTGRAPHGDRTDWVMHEYRLEDQGLADRGVPLDSYVLCMIFQKEGLGPRNGAQYGKPFNEEDWSDDEVAEGSQDANTPGPYLGLPCSENSPIATNTHSLEDVGIGPPSGSCISDILPQSCKVLQPVSSNYVTMEKSHASHGDDIPPTFDYSREENTFFMSENGKSMAEIHSEAVPNESMPTPNHVLPSNHNGFACTSAFFSERIGIGPSESLMSDIEPPHYNVLQLETGNYVTTEKAHMSDGDILSMFDYFTEESTLYMYGNDKIETGGCLETVLSANIPEPGQMLWSNYNTFISTSTQPSEVIGVGPSFQSCGLDVLPPSWEVLPPVSCNYVTMEKTPASNGDDILPMLDCFVEESAFHMNENHNNEELDNFIDFGNNAQAIPQLNTSNMYENLEDLGNNLDGYNFSGGHDDSANHFLELGDLDQPMNGDNSV
ncbi:NAC domain-containing protein 78-like [Pyrus ussuriensis x Pyrus communis]|uniref:NAC domain-containing protein 78-like n=1 Tax=Pyrus ussuriensis x Pyrus communis TaxID=2448454 RepID=A0A5N5H7E2_9ROSA|nr:NAC domain-containing protein 78-like [Pyrus ussuriensis x Pyrus communis]